MGVSAGGFNAIPRLLMPLPATFPLPIMIVQHIGQGHDNSFYLAQLNQKCRLKVREAAQLDEARPGNVYFAPAGYHLYIDHQKVFSLSVDDRENFSRPSIDLFFESAAKAYTSGLIGIILTGANSDGTLGMISIKENGGLTIVQDPKTAEAPEMPESVIKADAADYILPLNDIADFLNEKPGTNRTTSPGGGHIPKIRL